MNLLEAEKKFLQKKDFRKAFECLQIAYKDGIDGAYEHLTDFRRELRKAISKLETDDIYLLKESYKLSGREHFEDACIFVEWDRDDKFYTPRRKGLKRVADALQRLADDVTDKLLLSMPPGVGKSGIAIYFLIWFGLNHPELSILGGSHNNSFLRGVYDEILKELNRTEYAWLELFPERKVARTNAQDLKIDIDEPKRFSTFQFTSVGSGNAGKVRAIGLLYSDDLVEGIEEAMSPERLKKKWDLYTSDLRQRMQGRCKELVIMTRWSVHDIIGRLIDEYEGNERVEIINIPALNEDGESNFDYGGEKGFTKEFYEDIRRNMDDLSWNALYMGQPIEREGLLYNRKELRRFFELPSGEPDAILSICDTATGKGDDTFSPVGYVYGKDHYIYDCVCDDSLPEITDNRLASLLARNKVKMCRFESNNAGGRTADKVYELTLAYGWKCHITKSYTTQNKETKIVVNSPWVKEHCLFLDDSKIIPKSDYDKMMKNLCSYTLKGKNKHDDVPDGFSQYAIFSENLGVATVTVGKKFF